MFDIRTIPGADKLNQAFVSAGFEIRLVGGAVRDLLLKETPKDFDFATDATPAEMRKIAYANSFGCIATGEQHGTMTLVVDGEVFEVTTLRIDVETDGRHASVEFTRSFEHDAARRDLTFNAMSMDFAGKLYDYFDGQQDLADRAVRFVGNARQRVEEDYLRILRYFRFAARFNSTPDESTLKMFNESTIQTGLKTISVERYWLEMSKLFMAADAIRVLLLMQKYEVLKTIGIIGRFEAVAFAKADDEASKLSTFVPRAANRKDADEFCRQWKLSREITDKVVFLVSQRAAWASEFAIELAMANGIPRDYVVSWTKMADTSLVVFSENCDVPEFPVRGQDLLDLGLKPGPGLGSILKGMRDRWIATRFTASRSALLGDLETFKAVA